MRSIAVVCLLLVGSVLGDGLLLLYRPKDISGECAASRHLRFDLSFGMGMSDTTTLVILRSYAQLGRYIDSELKLSCDRLIGTKYVFISFIIYLLLIAKSKMDIKMGGPNVIRHSP